MTSPDFDYQFHQFLSQRQLFKKPVVLTYEDRDMYDFQDHEDQEYETYDQQSDTSTLLDDDNIINNSNEFEHSSTTSTSDRDDRDDDVEDFEYNSDDYSHHYLIDSSIFSSSSPLIKGYWKFDSTDPTLASDYVNSNFGFFEGKNRIFAKYGSWEALDGCKILLQVVGTICPPGKPHSVKKKFELFLGRLSSGGTSDFLRKTEN